MCRVRQPAYFDNLESTREGSKTLAQCSIASSKSCHLIIRMMLLFCKRGKVNSLSHVQLFVTPWTLAYQASQSVGFSRQQYWSGLPFPSPGDLPDPGSNSGLPHCGQTLYPLSHQGSPKMSRKICLIPFPG